MTGAGIEESIPWRWRAVSCDSCPAVMGRVVGSKLFSSDSYGHDGGGDDDSEGPRTPLNTEGSLDGTTRTRQLVYLTGISIGTK